MIRACYIFVIILTALYFLIGNDSYYKKISIFEISKEMKTTQSNLETKVSLTETGNMSLIKKFPEGIALSLIQLNIILLKLIFYFCYFQ
jgi:hypothetical protein